MLDRPLWPVGHGLTSKRLGNNLKIIRLDDRIEKGLLRCEVIEEILTKYF